MRTAPGATPEERGLLAGRAPATRPRTRAGRAHLAELPPTATGCSARSTTPRTCCRTRSCARGGLARFEGAARCDLALPDRDERLRRCVATRPKRVLPLDAVPSAGPGEAPGRPLPAQSVWIEAYPDRELGAPDVSAAPEARYELRVEPRARVRRAPASACAPARGADPARGARGSPPPRPPHCRSCRSRW